MMVNSVSAPTAPEGIVAAPLGRGDDLLEMIARHHFGVPERCWVIADGQGRTEPIVDEVWEAQRNGQDIRETRFARFVSSLCRSGVEFVCWCGGDFRELPVVHTWEELLHELTLQTAAQPADLFLHFQQ
jgi:hypothetical protein